MPEWVPPAWIGEHVGVRLVEAFKTLALMPVANGPRMPHNAWPRYKIEWADLLAQKEMERADKELRAAAANRVRLAPSRQDISRMESALVWPARYLQSRPLIMRCLHRVALLRSRGVDTETIERKLKRRPATVRAMNRAGLDFIATGLRRDAVPVF